MPLTAAQLKTRIAELLEVPKKQADDILWAFEQVCVEAVENADSLTIPGVGKLDCKVQKARKARNPATGEAVNVPAKITVKFKVSKTLKDQAPSLKKGQALIENREDEKRKSQKRRGRSSTTNTKARGRATTKKAGRAKARAKRF